MSASLLLYCAALFPSHAEGALHPQDGPDVDLRLRIDEDHVQVQIVVNLAFADEIVDAPREHEASLHPLEYDGLHAALYDYFHEGLVVEIDGIVVPPIDSGFEVQEADLAILPLFPGFGTRALIKARLTLEYPAKEAPQRVRFEWPAYPPDYVQSGPDGTPPLEVLAELLVAGDSTRVSFTQDEPEYTWHASPETYESRFLAVPAAPTEAQRALPLLTAGLIALVLLSGALCFFTTRGRPFRRVWAIGTPLAIAAAFTTTGIARVTLPDALAGGTSLPDQAQAVEVFRPLHANIYRAFDYADEGDVYDALSQSVDGELLDSMYTEIYHSLVMQEEGGAVARVQAVTPIETAIEAIGLLPPDDEPGFTVLARWQVEGAVFHFGHEHWRTNEYQARYQVRATPQGWRISEAQVLEARRVSANPGGPPPGMPEEL